MLPSETMIWQPEFTDKTLSRKPGAVHGASSYTWAEATWSQQLEDWVMSHVRCFQWLGGVPELV
ncbi:hypothetical protein, partial [Escherichia coli]